MYIYIHARTRLPVPVLLHVRLHVYEFLAHVSVSQATNHESRHELLFLSLAKREAG